MKSAIDRRTNKIFLFDFGQVSFRKRAGVLDMEWNELHTAIHAMIQTPHVRLTSSGSLALVMSLLLFAGITHPSLLSFVYFFLFCTVMTLWSRLYVVGDATLKLFLSSLQIYAGAHLVMLYLYQFDILQNAVPPESLAAR